MPERLTDQQLTDALRTLPAWHREGDTLQRSVVAEDFPAAIRLVVAVAETAESMNHHPDIDIRWRTLNFSLSTHSAGGLTSLDLDLAGRIDTLAGAEL
ncbi:4a-hydroxytetrahydrobiopterin dehydratase [Streptacidiphilus sp. P02-A3a]|uniref:4a-hydroxytetrahydrobiopterin dehydratase n=1 Tax=Streptacidiphilus sp. P02-A3a TaxID=2704468 RepID=UPI0015F903D2|nr:4a-hydroxytetrahydrobiopterin dehydratase [Streptacidiphilus sp. P02-A3a]QMU71900.1 4a-hydroxytetrahydrobiopterin dehydratase [Streptacidiphilus sp. P02-A3a]